MDEEKQTPNPYLIPFSILIAGFLIAGAILYTRNVSPTTQQAAIKTAPEARSDQAPASTANVRTVTNQDHIRGNPKAPVKIIEFSDLECPFCKRFHETMIAVMTEYGPKNQVAWVYRHFPLDSIHPKSRKEAEATECAAELGGNDKFWAYVDRLFVITPSNNGLDLTQLPQIAQEVGLDKKRFERCLTSGKFTERIEADYQDAVNSGGAGTPYSVVLAADGRKLVISGAQPLPAVKEIIATALGK